MYMLGMTGYADGASGDPTTRVATPQGESAVCCEPEVGKNPAPLRRLLAPIGGGGGNTVRLKVCVCEKPETLAVTLNAPGVDPAVAVTEACPSDPVGTTTD